MDEIDSVEVAHRRCVGFATPFRPRDIKELLPDYLAACRAKGIFHVRIIPWQGNGRLATKVCIRFSDACLKWPPIIWRARAAGGWGGNHRALAPHSSNADGAYESVNNIRWRPESVLSIPVAYGSAQIPDASQWDDAIMRGFSTKSKIHEVFICQRFWFSLIKKAHRPHLLCQVGALFRAQPGDNNFL